MPVFVDKYTVIRLTKDEQFITQQLHRSSLVLYGKLYHVIIICNAKAPENLIFASTGKEKEIKEQNNIFKRN